MIDNTPRWIKIGDALSQLLNVALLPRHKETTANESISGRAHRCGGGGAVTYGNSANTATGGNGGNGAVILFWTEGY